MRRFARVLAPAAAVVALACTSEPAAKADATATGDSAADAGLDVAGDATSADVAASPPLVAACPAPGRALVRQLQSDAEHFDGPAQLAAKGDWLLANDRAAFVVKAPLQNDHTYAYYGGLLVDAVALDGCVQAANERFGEMPFLVGNIDPADFPATVLRTFRGQSAEVLQDGKDGGAVKLRIHGVDDFFWLVELELIKAAFIAEKPKHLSAPLGVALALDYTLAPGRSALQIDLVVRNKEAKAKTVHVGAAAFTDDSTQQQAWSSGKLAVGGFTLRTGLPWLAGSAESGAIAIAVDSDNLANAHIAGVDALVPLHQLSKPLTLPATVDAEAKQTFWVGVGRGDSDTAVAAFEGLVIGGKSWDGVDVVGTVADPAGAGLPGAAVVLERSDNKGVFSTLLSTRSGGAGAFKLRVPRLPGPGKLRLYARAVGRVVGEPVALDVDAGPPAAPIDLKLGPAGALGHHVRDQTGKAIPARLSLWTGGKVAVLDYATGGKGSVAVPPGTYTLAVTRGYHYEPWSGTVTVGAEQTSPLDVTLKRVVDTTGWMGFDGHVHAHPSPDSDLPLVERYRGAAAEGLEVVIHTEHEIIIDSEPFRAASGVGAWVRGVPGQEVTATLPEHTNMYGVVPDKAHRRGAPVPWYGLDLAQIYAAERARGAGVVTLNHPRKGCNWLCVIGWDREKIAHGKVDPEALGLPKGATLWSWDFDAVELLNGMDTTLFIDPTQPHRTGTFEDWMSFWNSGHLVAAVGVTDTHGHGAPGAPRTYFQVPSDDLAAFDVAWLAKAVKAGQTMVGAGAFGRVSIAGKGPGELAPATAVQDGSVALKVRIEGIAAIDVTHLLVLVNCDTVAKVDVAAPNGSGLKHEATLPVPISKDSHVVVLAFGSAPMPLGLDGANAAKVPRLITNPIRVDADGDGVWTPPGGKACAIFAE